MNIKLFRNQNSDGGGGATGAIAAPTATASSPQGGAVAAPSTPAQGGSQNQSGARTETAYERFQSQLRQVATKETAKASQPTGDGNTGETANPTEGDDSGSNTDDQSTTDIQGDDSNAEDGKGALNTWSEEEQATLKAHGLDGMTFDEKARKLLSSNRELRSQFDRVSASNTNAIEAAENIRRAAYEAANGDAKALQDALGIDLKLNTRGPDDILKELQSHHNDEKVIFQEAISELENAGHKDLAEVLLNVGNRVLSRWNTKADIINTEKQWGEREKNILAKVGKAPEKSDAYKGMSEKAQNNLAAIATQDPESAKYFKEIEEATKPGGALAAMGINLARAYGTNLATAKYFNEVGKGLYLSKNQAQILNDAKKKWETDYARKQQFGGPKGQTTGGRSSGQRAMDPSISHLAGQMSAYMGRR